MLARSESRTVFCSGASGVTCGVSANDEAKIKEWKKREPELNMIAEAFRAVGIVWDWVAVMNWNAFQKMTEHDGWPPDFRGGTGELQDQRWLGRRKHRDSLRKQLGPRQPKAKAG